LKALTLWPLGGVSLAIAGAALLALTPTMPPGSTSARKTVVAEPMLLSVDEPPAVDVPPLPGQGVALLMGGSGTPIPPVDLTQVAFENYAVPNGFGDYAAERLFTPEGLSPIFSGIKSLPFDTSVAQGVTIVEDAIKANIEAGHNVLVGGVSQSATINALVEQDIANGALGFQPTPDQLAFISLGDPSNPNGGILERFNLPQDPNPTIPSLDLTFSGAAPADTGIPATIYTLEYDGFADFPRYPINFLSDLNAVAGMAIVHGQYVQGLEGAGIGLTPEQIANAIELPTTPGYDGGTTYFMAPFEGQLPLATLIQEVAGKPLADLLAPDLQVLVNLGYGPNPDIGWSDTPANVPTPVGLFPSIDSEQFNTILQALSTGAQQGFQAFIADLSAASSGESSGGALTDILDMFNHTAATIGPPSLTEIVNDFSSALSQSYSLLLPTADIINALTTTLPLAEATIFTNFLQEGDLVDAIGMPTAVATGLETVAAGIEAFVLLENLPSIASDLSSIF
jgi:hypothetical protein